MAVDLTRYGPSSWEAAKAAGSIVVDISRSISTFANIFQRYRGYLVGTSQERNAAAEKNITKPSTARYGIVFIGAYYADAIIIVLGILALLGAIPTLSGSLWLLAAINLVIALIFAVFSRIVLGRKLKNMKKERKALEQDIADIRKNINAINQRYKQIRAFTRASKFAAENPKLNAVLIATRKRMTAVNSYVAARPKLAGAVGAVGKGAGTTVRILAGPVVKIGGRAVPIINLIPWTLIGVFFTYIEHRREFKISTETLEAYQDGFIALLESEDTHFETRLAVSQAQLEAASEYAAERELDAVYYATA